MTEAVAVVLAAGEGERLGRGPKAFLEVGGRSILSMAIDAAAACPDIDELVVAVPSGFAERVTRSIVPSLAKPCRAVLGGRALSPETRSSYLR